MLMDGFPGIIVSDDDFGINSAGLMVTETTIAGFCALRSEWQAGIRARAQSAAVRKVHR